MSHEHAGLAIPIRQSLLESPLHAGIEIGRVRECEQAEELDLQRRGCLDPGLALVRKPFAPTELVRAVRDALDAPGPEGLTVAPGPGESDREE